MGISGTREGSDDISDFTYRSGILELMLKDSGLKRSELGWSGTYDKVKAKDRPQEVYISEMVISGQQEGFDDISDFTDRSGILELMLGDSRTKGFELG